MFSITTSLQKAGDWQSRREREKKEKEQQRRQKTNYLRKDTKFCKSSGLSRFKTKWDNRKTVIPHKKKQFTKYNNTQSRAEIRMDYEKLCSNERISEDNSCIDGKVIKQTIYNTERLDTEQIQYKSDAKKSRTTAYDYPWQKSSTIYSSTTMNGDQQLSSSIQKKPVVLQSSTFKPVEFTKPSNQTSSPTKLEYDDDIMAMTPMTKRCPCYYSTLFAQQDQGKNKIMNMMLKMGYQEGQGLGKSLQGIVEPVQAKSNLARSGLGVSSNNFDRKFYCTCVERKDKKQKPTKIGTRFEISTPEISPQFQPRAPIEIDLTVPEIIIDDDDDDKVIDLTSEDEKYLHNKEIFTNAVHQCKMKCRLISLYDSTENSENSFNSLWMPSFERLLEIWISEDYTMMLTLILEIKNSLPNNILNNVLKMIADKLRSKIFNWNPLVDHAHIWIKPWQEILGNTLNNSIIEKLKDAIRKWFPNRRPQFLLDPWRQFFNNEELADIASNVVFNLEVIFDEIDFDNGAHDSELWSYITDWFEFLDENTIYECISKFFFPKFEKKFIYFKEKSKHTTASFLNSWKKKFPKKILAQSTIQKYFDDKDLEINNMIGEEKKTKEIILINLE